MARRYCYKDVLPCAALIAVECSNVVENILFKAASSKGLSYYTFLAYSFALATLVLLPLTVFLISKTGLPPFKFPLISRLCLLGFVGMEKVVLRSSSSRAKISGTIASISGASVVVLYKGPKVLSSPHCSSSSVLLQQPLVSPLSNWVIGGLLLAMGYVFYSLWYIIQSQVMKIYPEEMIVTFIYNLSVVILMVPVSLLAESNMSSWRLRPSIVAASILYSGIFALSFSTVLHTWGVRLKGPVYVATFRPLSIVIAAVMSTIFLGEELYLGSVIGALILSAGLYAVLWGKAKEEEMRSDDDSVSSSSGPLSSCKVSLLQSHSDEEM